MAGSQDFAADPRNANARIWLQGNLVTRANAKVSVFDAGFVVGDGVWEGLRLHKGKLVFLDAHLDRLFAGAKAINLDIGLTRQGVMDALETLLRANGMEDGVHLRLMVTRGEKLERIRTRATRWVFPPLSYLRSGKFLAPPWSRADCRLPQAQFCARRRTCLTCA